MKTLIKIATPPSLGVRVLWTFRSFGLSIAPTTFATRITQGVSTRDNAIEEIKATINGITINY
jgi:hypothetical protein